MLVVLLGPHADRLPAEGVIGGASALGPARFIPAELVPPDENGQAQPLVHARGHAGRRGRRRASRPRDGQLLPRKLRCAESRRHRRRHGAARRQVARPQRRRRQALHVAIRDDGRRAEPCSLPTCPRRFRNSPDTAGCSPSAPPTWTTTCCRRFTTRTILGPIGCCTTARRPAILSLRLPKASATSRRPSRACLGNDSFKGMGVDFADVNHDGFLDIYVSNIADEMALHESHFVWVSNGKPEAFKQGIAPVHAAKRTTRHVAERLGLGHQVRRLRQRRRNRSAAGHRHVQGHDQPLARVAGAGHEQRSHRERPALVAEVRRRNRHQRPQPESVLRAGIDRARWSTFAPSWSMDEPYNSRGISVADVDGDGRLDYAIANQWEPSYFFKNDRPEAGHVSWDCTCCCRLLATKRPSSRFATAIRAPTRRAGRRLARARP